MLSSLFRGFPTPFKSCLPKRNNVTVTHSNSADTFVLNENQPPLPEPRPSFEFGFNEPLPVGIKAKRSRPELEQLA